MSRYLPKSMWLGLCLLAPFVVSLVVVRPVTVVPDAEAESTDPGTTKYVAPAYDLQTCFEKYCMVGVPGYRLPQCMLAPHHPQVLLPGICIIDQSFLGCSQWLYYGDYCSSISAGSFQTFGAGGVTQEQCLIDNCFADGKGQCDGDPSHTFLPDACVLLSGEVSGTQHTLTPGCEAFANVSRPCSYVEQLRKPVKAAGDGGCSASGRPGRSGQALPLLALGFAAALGLLWRRRQVG